MDKKTKQIINETIKIENQKSIQILNTLVKKRMAYATTLDETSRLNSLMKEFKEEITR